MKLIFSYFLRIRFAFAIIITIAYCGFSPLLAQVENQRPVPHEQSQTVEIPFEKVYLHLDRPYYSSGDNIWIKAYLVDALTNKLFDNSNNLYVELLSPESKIIRRLMLRMDKGIGAGDIQLGSSLKSGNYQIRAYTNWMRNFGDIFFFRKEITIENPDETKIIYQPVQEESNENVDLQFFPEGGPLIENVFTLVGFKAVNSSGYGCNVKGQVFSSLGDSVTSFSGTHLGMGSFVFIAKKGLKYYAACTTGKGTSFKVELPPALETGYSIKVNDINRDYFRVTVKTNQETLDRLPLNELIIAGTSHNSLCVAAKVTVRMIDNQVTLPKKEFPEGIALITLMDTTGIKFCERVCYIHTMDNYRISIIPENETYAPRQKVTLNISVRDTSGKPVSAKLSVSVVDGNQIKGVEKKPDISSYLLLESEIRGYIEQPAYYFDTTVADRYKALDNLLLTQGWRNFVWQSFSDTAIKYNYPAEKGITISGSLRHVWLNSPIGKANISIALQGNANPIFRLTQTDNDGRYFFDGLNFTGTKNILVSAEDDLNRKTGLILLDSIYRNPAPIIINPKFSLLSNAQNSPDNKNVSPLTESSDYNELSTYKEEAIRKYDILKGYHLIDTIALGEVVVSARKSENIDEHPRQYGIADFSLKVTEQMINSVNVMDALRTFGAGSFIVGDPRTGYRIFVRGEIAKPLYLLDGIEVDESNVISLPTSSVDKVEIIKDIAKVNVYDRNSRHVTGIISVFTKSGSDKSSRPVLYSINQQVYGYYQARTFYTPVYNNRNTGSETPDLRTTIYWEPNIVTDRRGNATLSFFNADSRTIMKVDAEGISEQGIPLTGKVSLEVK
jgi:hypothetical protein